MWKCTQLTTEYEFVERYSSGQAERKYREYLKEKGPDVKIDHALVRRLEELVATHGFSPGAALVKIRNNGELFSTGNGQHHRV